MMIDRDPLRYARGTAAEVAAYAGPLGEPVINTDTGDVHVQNATPGGIRQISDKSLITPEGGSFPAPLVSVIGRSMDLRKFGACSVGSAASAAQRDANTKTIGEAVLAAFYDRRIGLIDYPAGDLYLGQGPDSGTIRYNNALCYMQGCDNLLLRGNNTRVWLPGDSEANYLGFFTFMFNTGVCGFTGNWTIRLQNAATCDGVIAAYSVGQSIDVDLSIVPTWGGTSQSSPGRVKNVHRWSPDGRPQGHLAARTARGLPMWPISGGEGRRYRIDITGNDGVIDILNPTLTAAGVLVSLQHCTYTANVLYCAGNEHLVFHPGFTINDGAGMGLVAFGGTVEWDGTIEPPLVNGVPRHLATVVDGVHLKGAGKRGHVRGRILGTGDDCINIGCAENAILSVASSASVTVDLGAVASNTPVKGERVLLVNEAAQGKLETTVLSRADNTSNQGVLTFTDELPSGVGVGWRVVNVTTAENYQVDAVVGGNLGAGCRSSAYSAHVALRACKTLLEAAHQGSFFTAEYCPSRIVTFDVLYDRVNSSLDPLRRGYGVVAVNPRRADLTDVVTGAAGDFKITRLQGKEANAPLLYMRGAGKVSVTSPHGDGLNPMFQSDDFTNLAYAQFVNCADVELYAPTNFGTSPLHINLSGVGRFKMRDQQNVVPPSTGASVIDVDARGDGYYKDDGKLWQWGIVSGYPFNDDPHLVFPIPFARTPSFVPSIRLDDGSVAYMVTVNYSSLTASDVYLRPRYIGSPDGTVTKVMKTNPDIPWQAVGDA